MLLTAEIAQRVPLPSSRLSNRRLPAAIAPAQCMPSSLLLVGKPWKVPTAAGALVPTCGTPGGKGMLYLKLIEKAACPHSDVANSYPRLQRFQADSTLIV